MSMVTVDGETIGEIRKVSLEPGDILVLTVDHKIGNQEAAYIRDQVKHHLPGHDVIIVSGATVGVLKPIAEPDGAEPTICTRSTFAGEPLNGPCPECGHATVAHVGNVRCPICVLVATGRC